MNPWISSMGNKPQNLPSDVVHEILLSLPVKTLIKLRCVCKLWDIIIRSSPFQKEHYLRSQQKPRLLVTRTSYNFTHHINTLSISTYHTSGGGGGLLNRFERTEIPGFPIPCYYPIQSCLGLVCIKSQDDRPEINDLVLLICNPSTQKLITLPTPPQPTLNVGTRYVVGFGFKNSSKEFKFVRFCFGLFSLFGTDTHCQIFTLGSGDGWRESKPPPPGYFRESDVAPFLHGALHLLPNFWNRHIEGDSYVCYICAFDIETEDYRRIRLPEYYPNIHEQQHVFLTELGGALCLSVNNQTSEEQLELWLLKDYGSGEWVKEYNIEIFTHIYGSIYAWPIAVMGGRIYLHVRLRDDKYTICELYKSPHFSQGYNYPNSDRYEVREWYELHIYNPTEGNFRKGSDNKLCSAIFYVESFLGYRN